MKRAALLLVLLAAAAALSGGVGRSQATFVAGSDQAAQTFAASAVFNGVTVNSLNADNNFQGKNSVVPFSWAAA